MTTGLYASMGLEKPSIYPLSSTPNHSLADQCSISLSSSHLAKTCFSMSKCSECESHEETISRVTLLYNLMHRSVDGYSSGCWVL